MTKFNDILRVPVMAAQYVAGVAERRIKSENLYRLAFNKEANERWYIDLPSWTGSHANLQMVAGADDLLDFLLKKNNRVEAEVVKSDEPIPELDADERFFRCDRIDTSVFSGATYTVNGLDGFNKTMWICPVTLFVLGEYPKYIYISQIN